MSPVSRRQFLTLTGATAASAACAPGGWSRQRASHPVRPEKTRLLTSRQPTVSGMDV